MAEFWIPDAAEFATWSEDSRPIAVVRLTCAEDHPITEWWRTHTGSEHPWGGIVGSEVDAPRAVRGQMIGYATGPSNPERPDDKYERTVLKCPECEYNRPLTPEGVTPVTRMLDALLAGLVPESLRFAHPSGAVAALIKADQIFGYRRV